MTQALSDTTWLLLVCAGFILGDYDKQESRDQHIQSLELGKAKIAMHPTSPKICTAA